MQLVNLIYPVFLYSDKSRTKYYRALTGVTVLNTLHTIFFEPQKKLLVVKKFFIDKLTVYIIQKKF